MAAVRRLRFAKRERSIVLLLNRNKELISAETVAIGTPERVEQDGMDVFLPAMVRHAVYVILVHNHPDGRADPSKDDWAATKHFVNCGKKVGIKVLDHVIVSRRDGVSLREANKDVFKT